MSAVEVLTYDPQLSRVRIELAGLTELPGGTPIPAESVWTVQRSPDRIRWTVVRGGGAIPVSAAARPLDDYEFPADVLSNYRVTVYNGGSAVHTFEDAITPVLTSVWLKNLIRPYLNRAVAVQDMGDVTRPSRTGVFAVAGRATPIAVADVRGGRQFDLSLVTDTNDEAADLDAVLAYGDVLFVHVPTTCPIPVPTMYAAVGDTTAARIGRLSPVRVWTLPLTETAAPGADVIGSTITWGGVTGTYATWTDLLADPAAGTWSDVLEQVGSPDVGVMVA